MLISIKTQGRTFNLNIGGIDDIVVHCHILGGGTSGSINGIVSFEGIVTAFHIVVDYPGAAAGSVKSDC